MIRGILAFLIVWISVTTSIGVVRRMSGKEMWSVAKLLSYGLLTASIAFFIIVSVVILF